MRTRGSVADPSHLNAAERWGRDLLEKWAGPPTGVAARTCGLCDKRAGLSRAALLFWLSSN